MAKGTKGYLAREARKRRKAASKAKTRFSDKLTHLKGYAGGDLAQSSKPHHAARAANGLAAIRSIFLDALKPKKANHSEDCEHNH